MRVEEPPLIPFRRPPRQLRPVRRGDAGFLRQLLHAGGDDANSGQVDPPFPICRVYRRGVCGALFAPLAALSETDGVTSYDPSVNSINAFLNLQGALRENFDDLRTLLDDLRDDDLARS